MNKVHQLLYFIAAGTVAGVALVDFAGFFTGLPIRGQAALIAAVSAGIVLITVRDYARRAVVLRPRAVVTRPPLRVRATRRVEAIVERAA